MTKIYQALINEIKINNIRFTNNEENIYGKKRLYNTILIHRNNEYIDLFNINRLIGGNRVNLNGCMYYIDSIKELSMDNIFDNEYKNINTKIRKFKKKYIKSDN